MENKILVAVNDSQSSRNALDYLAHFSRCLGKAKITLVHVFRKPLASEELMGEKYMHEQQRRFMKTLTDSRDRLLAMGASPENVVVNLITTPYPTVTEGIIDQFKKSHYNMVVLGRKRMSKAEEFVLGDVGVKLVRALEGVAILVVKS